jgi:hypothetical protein
VALLNFSSAPFGGELRLLPENATQPAIRPTQLIFHSIVGSAAGALSFFRNSSNLESTFIVTKAGRIWQLMDTARQADANSRANVRAGSVETEDNGDPDTDPWTEAQLQALAWIARQYNRLHGVPLRGVARWDQPGIGFHRQFPEWLGSPKTCPGHVRVRQFQRVLLPAIMRGEDPDMPYGHWPADHREALVRDVAARVKHDAINLDRMLLQFLAGGQSNSVYPGAASPWRTRSVTTPELDERLRQLLEALRGAGFLEAAAADAGPAAAGETAAERAEVAAALRSTIDAGPAGGESSGRMVDVALLERAVALLGGAQPAAEDG